MPTDEAVTAILFIPHDDGWVPRSLWRWRQSISSDGGGWEYGCDAETSAVSGDIIASNCGGGRWLAAQHPGWAVWPS